MTVMPVLSAMQRAQIFDPDRALPPLDPTTTTPLHCPNLFPYLAGGEEVKEAELGEPRQEEAEDGVRLMERGVVRDNGEHREKQIEVGEGMCASPAGATVDGGGLGCFSAHMSPTMDVEEEDATLQAAGFSVAMTHTTFRADGECMIPWMGREKINERMKLLHSLVQDCHE